MVIARSDTVTGANLIVRDVSVELRDRGIEPVVLVGGRGPYVDVLDDAGLRYAVVPHLQRPLNPVTDLRALLALRREFIAVSPDVVVAHTAKAGLLARPAARLARLPSVYAAHGWPFGDGVPSFRARFYRTGEKLLDTLVPGPIVDTSEGERSLALDHGIGPPERHVLVYNGLDDDVGPQADASREPPRIIMVARFEPQKDHTTLLGALARLTDLDWKVELVGDGPGLPEMRERARALGLDGRVWFAGVRDDVPARLAGAQIAVLTTNWEGFPLVVLEAMRAALPVVASDVAGVPEQVVHGETGYLTPRGDAVRVADALRALVTDAGLRTRLGSAGRERFLDRFTRKQQIDGWERVLRGAGDLASPSR